MPKQHIDHTKNIFNSYSDHLQFIIEKSFENKISFLDLLIIKNIDNTISTDWYGKPTFSGRFLNYKSHHPVATKIGVICNLVDRPVKLADKKYHKSNVQFIKQLLVNNQYPAEFIDKHIKIRLQNIYQNHIPIHNVNRIKRIILPFTKQIDNELRKALNQHYICPVYKPINKFNCLIKLGEDKYQLSEKTNVVYKIKCNTCDASYVGQTSRSLKQDLKNMMLTADINEINQLYLTMLKIMIMQ